MFSSYLSHNLLFPNPKNMLERILPTILPNVLGGAWIGFDITRLSKKLATNLALVWLLGLSLGVGMSLPAVATIPTPTAPTASTVSHSVDTVNTVKTAPAPILASRQQIRDIIYDESFSRAIPQTRWVEKNPKPKTQSSFARLWERFIEWLQSSNGTSATGMGALLALLLKIAVLLALLAFVVWLYLRRDIWLKWFGIHIAPRQARKTAQLETQIIVSPKTAWQGLPAKAQLADAVRHALSRHDYVQALSLLYRGTLRELLQRHELPITQATTEQQCAWLLAQAVHKQTDEARYFHDLVRLWSLLAYGEDKTRATTVNAQMTEKATEKIEQLLNVWQRLYLANQASNTFVRQTAVQVTPNLGQ